MSSIKPSGRTFLRGNLAKPAILIHGGAGSWNVDLQTRERIIRFLRDLAKDSYDKLEQDFSALDAVEYAVAKLEDSGIFNAGYGSALNIKGFAEMDAGIMDGSTMKAGAVAMVRNVKNPVKIARKILSETDHVLLGGLYDEDLIRILGIERSEDNPEIRRRYREIISSGNFPQYYRRNIELIKRIRPTISDTVGAVALDRKGGLAAATSTGGIWLKLPGRIGDSPIPGAGFYADREIACSATGVGEAIMSVSLCRSIALHNRYLRDLGRAVEESFDELERFFGSDTAGVIVLEVSGDYVICYNTRGMARGFMASSLKDPVADL
ncbi:MAG: isoaspartyl peptidase/L-asparaginase [Sulfolobales archaeon]